MVWEVEYTNEFFKWWNQLNNDEQADIDAIVGLLENMGPTLDHPYCSAISQSKYPHMRELRIQHQGRPYRILYAFDPRRVAILLIGGDKTGQDRWYEKSVPKADKLYGQHLKEIEEGK